MRLPREDKILGKAQLRSNWLRKLWFQMQRAAEGRTNSDAIVRHVSWQNVSLPSWSLKILTNQISKAVEKTLPSLADSLRTIRLNRLRDGRVMEFIHAACLELSRATKQRSDFETVFDSISQSGAIIDLSSSSSWKKQEWMWSRASGILIRLVPSSSTPLDKSVSSDSSQDHCYYLTFEWSGISSIQHRIGTRKQIRYIFRQASFLATLSKSLGSTYITYLR